MFQLSLTSITSCCLLVDDGLNATEKRITEPVFADFYVLDISIKIDKIDRLITKIDKIDNQEKSTDQFPSSFDINR